MRLIDADALGNRLYHEVFEKDSEDQRWDSGCWMRYRLFEKVLREQPTVEQPEQQWIPCSERLPFDAGYYLTTTTYNEVFCDYWNLNEWNRTEQVIAWMPLPEPYKEVE